MPTAKYTARLEHHSQRKATEPNELNGRSEAVTKSNSPTSLRSFPLRVQVKKGSFANDREAAGEFLTGSQDDTRRFRFTGHAVSPGAARLLSEEYFLHLF
jgi:hypothetical protein